MADRARPVQNNLDVVLGFLRLLRAATVFRQGGLRVVVYSMDHPPAHVHALGAGCEARFALNCPDGPVRMIDQIGFQRAALNDVGEAIAERLSECCEM